MTRAFITRGSHSISRVGLALGQLHFNCNRKELANEPSFARICSFPAVMVLGDSLLFLLLLRLSAGEGKMQSSPQQELSTERHLCS